MQSQPDMMANWFKLWMIGGCISVPIVVSILVYVALLARGSSKKDKE